MTPAQLRAWQSLLNLTQADAAKLLGMSLGGYKKLVLGISRIDHRTDLACAAIAAKVPHWSQALEH
jgi:transcriptional regulator with XRE-family HTH domain